MVLSIKPEIPDAALTQWQGIVDLMATVCRIKRSLGSPIQPRHLPGLR